MRADLIKKLEQAAMLAEAAGEMSAAGILWTLIGAMVSRMDGQLEVITYLFTQKALKAFDAPSN